MMPKYICPSYACEKGQGCSLRTKDPEVLEFKPKDPLPITCLGPIEVPPARSYWIQMKSETPLTPLVLYKRCFSFDKASSVWVIAQELAKFLFFFRLCLRLWLLCLHVFWPCNGLQPWIFRKSTNNTIQRFHPTTFGSQHFNATLLAT